MTARVSRRGLLSGLAAGGALSAAAGPAHRLDAGLHDPPDRERHHDRQQHDLTGLPLRVVLLDLTPSAYSATDPARATVVVRARIEHRGSDR